MSQGSGSPVNLIDNETCDEIPQGLRGADGQLPSFNSNLGSPPPALEAEVAHGKRATQTSPVSTSDQSTDTLTSTMATSDQATQVVSRPHQATSGTQTPSTALASDQSTQVLLRPPRSVAFTQTATEAKSTRTSWTQVPHTDLRDTGTDMPVIEAKTAECQAGCFFDNDVIPPGAPRPKLLWAYSYAQFDQLLQAYPEVHPLGSCRSSHVVDYIGSGARWPVSSHT